jgi:hypothetical protein
MAQAKRGLAYGSRISTQSSRIAPPRRSPYNFQKEFGQKTLKLPTKFFVEKISMGPLLLGGESPGGPTARRRPY